jgi:NAD(P)-dependent dehydrogenase (short-subunit alcohol dehydrogenase family)
MSKALRVLITGAARGIGLATAQLLANRGHSVVATDVSALSGLEGIQAHVLDVTSDDSVARCLEEVGPLDAIVNNAGITSGGGPVEGYPLDRFRQMFETNTLGALRLIPGGLARLAKAGFRRHRECIKCERPSLLAAPSSVQRLQVRARSLDGVTAPGSPSLWNTQRVNRAMSHRYWHKNEPAS